MPVCACRRIDGTAQVRHQDLLRHFPGRNVLVLLAAGLPEKSIARRLGIGIPTVKTYTGRTYRKQGARSRAGAVAQAARLGLIDLSEAANGK